MILSNAAIFEALDDGRLAITPEPEPRFDAPGGQESPYSTCSVDLTLSPLLHVPDAGVPLTADLRTGQGVSRALAALTAVHQK